MNDTFLAIWHERHIPCLMREYVWVKGRGVICLNQRKVTISSCRKKMWGRLRLSLPGGIVSVLYVTHVPDEWCGDTRDPRKGNPIHTVLEVILEVPHWRTVPRGSISPHAVSNHGPFHYEWNALPLSYMGKTQCGNVAIHNPITVRFTMVMHNFDAPNMGLKPTTTRSKAERSSNWANWAFKC